MFVRATVLWQCLDRPTLEFFQWTDDHEVAMRGEVVGDIGGIPGRVKYQVRTGSDWLTRVVRIQFRFDTGGRYLHLSRNLHGQWHVNGTKRPDLANVTDVDIGVTPATNTLPIRRFRLAVGESRNLVAAWVQFPALSVTPAHQRYTRIAADRYLYESLDSGYQAELTVQNDGIVVQYANVWRVLTTVAL